MYCPFLSERLRVCCQLASLNGSLMKWGRMRSVKPKRFTATALITTCLLLIAGSSLAASSWVLTGPESTREGYFQLHLQHRHNAGASAEFTIELSGHEDFATIDQEFSPLGSFAQLSLSGFDDGVYYFRARTATNEFSNIHRIEVTHYPLWQALSTFVIGAILLISLLTTLMMLHRRYRSAQ